jgi:hypothetical protein
MLNRTDCKRALTNLWEVLEKGLNVVLYFVQANSVHYSRLLVTLLLLKTAYVKRLNQVGLIRRELDYLDIVYFSCNNKVGRFVASSTVY